MPGLQLEEVGGVKPAATERDYYLTLAELREAFRLEGDSIKQVSQRDVQSIRITTIDRGEKHG